jgi:hypothetical protein
MSYSETGLFNNAAATIIGVIFFCLTRENGLPCTAAYKDLIPFR